MVVEWKREKRWRYIFTRSAKLHRARQLGRNEPRKSESPLMPQEAINVLFVCSMNRWRSRTAEKVYAKNQLVNARSRGTSRKAVQTLGIADLQWADVIMVMEDKHRQQLLAWFPRELQHAEVHTLHIPDDYQAMDPDLIAIIRESVDPLLGEWRV